MFTVCPKCALTLAVTAADLRTGQGYVRCGRCLNVFNALLGLSEAPAEGAAPAPAYSPTDAADAPQEPETSGLRAHVTDDDAPRTYLATERSSDGAIENESSLAEGTGSFETIVLEGDAFTQTEEFVPEESIDHEIAALTQRLSNAQHEHDEQHGLQHDSARTAPSFIGSEFTESDVDDIVVAPPPQRAGWLVGCIVLLLLLAAQLINHWRDALASTPLLSAPLASVYAQMGVPLDPHWNLGAYDVRQQGAAADPLDSHVIRVRLSVANHEQRPQPAPLLRLTLLDRYGKPIAARDLTPTEYWPAGLPARTMLAHDERIDSEVALRDPAPDSASFELDVCLKSAGGVVHCAGDAPLAPAPSP
jgi:predicted Zn finger-like uncharacterized protein